MSDQTSGGQEVPRGIKQDRAKMAVAAAIKAGTLKREVCELCGRDETEGHHDDYDEPLVVRWLCRSHHTLVHKALNDARPADPPIVSPPTITMRRFRQTVGQISNPVMVVMSKGGEYTRLGLWVPAKRYDV